MNTIDSADNDLKQVIIRGISCIFNWFPGALHGAISVLPISKVVYPLNTGVCHYSGGLFSFGRKRGHVSTFDI
jgi:hypothetical protein